MDCENRPHLDEFPLNMHIKEKQFYRMLGMWMENWQYVRISFCFHCSWFFCFFQDKQEYFTLHKASTKGTTQLQAEGHFTLILWYVLFSLLKTLQWLKCRTSIKILFLYFNLCLIVTLDSLSLSCSFLTIFFLTNKTYQICYRRFVIENILEKIEMFQD